MQYLFTGLIGSGKTLNAIKFVNEAPQFKDRPVYYTHIDELTLGWKKFDPELLKTWWDFPENAVIIVDEAHYYFPNLGQNKERPEHYKRLTEQRHEAIDFVFITQFPDQLDKHVRKHTGQHRHYIPLPPILGRKKAKVLIFPKCMDMPDHQINWKFPGTQKQSIFLDKKYYGMYKTAQKVTETPKMPKWVYVGLAFVFSFVVFMAYFFSTFMDKLDRKKVSQKDINQPILSQPQLPNIEKDKEIAYLQEQLAIQQSYISELQDINNYLPKVGLMPWTANIYQESIKVQSIPYISGCSNFGRVGDENCRCYTQQRAVISMSNDMCLLVLQNWIHQPHVSDELINPKPRQEGSSRAAGDDSRRAARDTQI